MQIPFSGPRFNTKPGIPTELRREINSLAHHLAQMDFTRHRNELLAHAEQLLREGADHDTVVRGLRDVARS